MFKRYLAALLCAAAVAASLSACGGGSDVSGASGAAGSAAQPGSLPGGRLKVSVSFNALKEFTEAVGKDRVDISTIIPDGMEPHDFEPKAQDLVGLGTAKVFVYSGLGMEAWAQKAAQSADNPDLVTVEASKGAQPIQNAEQGGSGGHGQYDPHVWISLKGAELEVGNIRDGLVRADPSNRDYYEKNCSAYTAKLEDLYGQYNAKFKSAKRKNFVTGHAAFAYLCRDFGLEQNSVKDVFSEGEPSARQLVQLVAYCKAHGVTAVFAEEMASPEVSQTLAQEVGVKVETIYTMESAEDNKTYLERAESNLSKIYGSL